MKQRNRLLIGFCMLWSTLSQAEVRIVITEGIDSARPIAVVPFKWSGPGEHPPQEMAAIIAADLRNSGKFNPIEVDNMPQKPTTVSEVTPALWKNLGIDAVVIGQLQAGENGSFLVSYQLVGTASLSAANGVVLEQNQYRASTPWLRYAAHKVSDRVFEHLTAIKGAFSTRMAYVLHVNDTKYPYELRVADYDGHNQFMLYRSLEPIMSLAWSPDGRKLAYVTFENHHSELMLHDLASAKRQRLAAFPRHNGAPAFSFDGTQLALALSKDGSLKIYLMDLASYQLTRITEGNSNDTEPAWHPDGKSIIFTSDRAGRPEIYQLNLPERQINRLTWHGAQNQGGKITPDGCSLVMVNRGDDGYHIAKQDLATNTVQVLTNTFLDEAPSIAPNGTMIIYSSTEAVGKALQLVSMDGRFKARLLATNGQVRFPAWSPYL